MTGAGSLDTRVSIFRESVATGGGGVVRTGVFALAFRRWAKPKFMPRPEELEAGRAVDRQPAEFILRDEPQTRTITAADRLGLKDAERGEYEIVAVIPARREYPFIHLKCEIALR